VARARRRDLVRLAGSVPRWRHSIDLGGGVVTEGSVAVGDLSRRWAELGLGDLRGRTVLDVGAGDGFFAFAAEEAGATRVVALEHRWWATDPVVRERYLATCRARGVAPHPGAGGEGWDPDGLPGKAGFDVVHRARASRVEAVVADFMTVDLDWLGPFDVVLFLDELNAVRHPLLALERVAAVTGEVACLSAEAVAVPGFEHHGFTEFFETGELGGDGSGWWAPNLRALETMCRAAGFGRVACHDPVRARAPAPDALHRYEAVLTAWR